MDEGAVNIMVKLGAAFRNAMLDGVFHNTLVQPRELYLELRGPNAIPTFRVPVSVQASAKNCAIELDRKSVV